MSSLLVCEHLYATDLAGPAGRPRGRVDGLSLHLPSGVYALLGAPADGTFAFVEAVASIRPPRHGRILVAGRDIVRAPAARRLVGALLPEPLMPDGGTVAQSLDLALAAAAKPTSAGAVLGPLGLASLADRPWSRVSYADARGVELALALAQEVRVLVLHEPFADLTVGADIDIAALIAERGQTGCVVITTSSPRDALRVADRIFVLDRGRIARDADASGEGLAAPALAEIVVRLAAGGPDMLRELGGADGIRLVSLETTEDGRQTLRLRADDADQAALAIVDGAARTGAEIVELTTTPPALAHVRAYSAYHLAMAAQPMTRARAPYGAAVAAPPQAEVAVHAAPVATVAASPFAPAERSEPYAGPSTNAMVGEPPAAQATVSEVVSDASQPSVSEDGQENGQ